MTNDSGSRISEKVKNFIAHHITSIGQLEVLLFLYRHKEESFTVAVIAQELRSATSAMAGHLNHLCDQELVWEKSPDPPAYSFFAKSEEMETIVAELSQLGASYNTTVISLIYNKPDYAMRSLANAFKLRKGGDPHG